MVDMLDVLLDVLVQDDEKGLQLIRFVGVIALLDLADRIQFIDLVRQYSRLDDAGKLYINGAIAMASGMMTNNQSHITKEKGC